MKKFYLLSILLLVIAVAVLPQNMKTQISVWDGTYAPWTHGSGNEADLFLIENTQQMAYLAYCVNNGSDVAGGLVFNNNLLYKLMTDVNLIGYWIPENIHYSFGGHFNGNNYCFRVVYQ